ncbi:MAG: hypothetical protein F6K42_14730 [Leptolyngbya sp. SIO1D8]|nr:hypothetical protein [Leptolyngbya sp. SIO1D8]
MLTLLISVAVVGWIAAAVIGTQAYYFGEQTKPIHERNWNSEGFEKAAKLVTGRETDYNNRVPSYSGDAFTSNSLGN